MDDVARLLRQCLETQERTLRLLALSVTLQAESLAIARFAATGGKPSPAADRLAGTSVKQVRCAIDRALAGKRPAR